MRRETRAFRAIALKEKKKRKEGQGVGGGARDGGGLVYMGIRCRLNASRFPLVRREHERLRWRMVRGRRRNKEREGRNERTCDCPRPGWKKSVIVLERTNGHLARNRLTFLRVRTMAAARPSIDERSTVINDFKYTWPPVSSLERILLFY